MIKKIFFQFFFILFFGFGVFKSIKFFYFPNWFYAKRWTLEHLDGMKFFLPQTKSQYERDKKIVYKYFDANFYMKNYEKEVKKWCQENQGIPLDHFMKIGWKKRYNPNSWFDSGFYLDYFSKSRNPFLDFLDASWGIDPSSKLIVSMTSYPPRIGKAWIGIQSILRQKFKPNRVLLYLAEDEFPDHKLPKMLEILKNFGLEVRFVENYRIATKLIPALKDFPNYVLCTADDDNVYDADFLQRLWREHLRNPKDIIAGSAFFPLEDQVTKYASFYNPPRIDKTWGMKKIGFLFEGINGVLYPPNSLDKEVFNIKNFLTLTPYADDLWFSFMAAKKGTYVKVIDDHVPPYFYNKSFERSAAGALHSPSNVFAMYRIAHYYNLFSIMGWSKHDQLFCKKCKKNKNLLPSYDFSKEKLMILLSQKKLSPCCLEYQEK